MDQRLIGFLLGDRQHPAALFEARRDAIFDEAHKGFDGSQARVAGTGTIAPLGLQMREKIHHQLGIEMLQTGFPIGMEQFWSLRNARPRRCIRVV